MKTRALVVALATSLWAGVASAEYVIGPRDVLQVSVWQRQELDRTVSVRGDGFITFPPVGDVRAAGLTTERLAASVEEQLFAYTRATTKVTITVLEFNSQFVVVSGQVATPGRYSFETIPNLFQVLSLAGGALPGARLASVRVVRTAGERAETFTVDLNRYLETGDPSVLPALVAGDQVFVPGAAAAAPGEMTLPGMGTIAIIGAVTTPGIYPVDQIFGLPEAVAVAGGLRPDADLREVRILSREPDGSEVVASVDLERLLERGTPLRYPIRPGDALYIPPRRPGTLGTVSQGTLSLLSLSRDILNFVVLYDVLTGNTGN